MKLIRFALWLIITIVGAVYTLLIVMPITVVAAIVYYWVNPDEALKVAEQSAKGCKTCKTKFTGIVSMVFGVDVIDDIRDKLNWWSEKKEEE